jgi:hypothetical protein
MINHAMGLPLVREGFASAKHGGSLFKRSKEVNSP